MVFAATDSQNSWKKRLVDPSPYDLRSAGLTKALHNGHVLSLSNLEPSGLSIIQHRIVAYIKIACEKHTYSFPSYYLNADIDSNARNNKGQYTCQKPWPFSNSPYRSLRPTGHTTHMKIYTTVQKYNVPNNINSEGLELDLFFL